MNIMNNKKKEGGTPKLGDSFRVENKRSTKPVLSKFERRRLKRLELKRKEFEKTKEDFFKTKIRYIDTLATKPLRLADLYKSVAKPFGSDIDKGLPSWNAGPLDLKLVYITPPNEDFVFTRGKIGQKLWQRISGADFVMTDPYCYEVNIPYEPLHDEHLREFLNKKTNFLKKIGLITDKLDAQCSLKEFNYYRKYLYQLHSEALRKEALERGKKEIELRTVKQYMKNTEKEIQQQTRREKIGKRRKVAEAKREAEKQKQIERCRQRVERVYEVQKQNERKLQLALVEAEERNRIFKERIQQRVVVAAEIEHKKKIEALFQKQEADYNQKQKEENEKRTRQEERKRKIQERWDQKVHIQKFQIMRENMMRNMRAESLKERACRLQRNNTHLKDCREQNLEILKKKHHIETLYNVKLKDAAMKKFYEPPSEKKKKAIIRPDIEEIVERFKRQMVDTIGNEGEVIFLSVEEPLEKKSKVPEEVDHAITHLLNAVVKRFVRKYVEMAVVDLIKKVLKVYNGQKNYWKKKYGKGKGMRDSFVRELLCVASTINAADYGGSQEFALTEQLLSSTMPLTQDFTTIDHSGDDLLQPDMIEQTKTQPVGLSYTTVHQVMNDASQMLSTVSKDSSSQEERINFSENEKFFTTLRYLTASILFTIEIKIVNYFVASDDITDLPEISDIDLKHINLIEYITSTLLHFAGTRTQIDRDVCVNDISDFFARHILYLV